MSEMGAFFDSEFERARHAPPSFEHDPKEKEMRIGFYQQEIGKFLSPPFRFDLPAEHVRLTDRYPDSFYMCRNSNRTAVAGFIEELIEDPIINLGQEQRDALQIQHQRIIEMPLDTWGVGADGERQKITAWRTPEEMEIIKTATEEAYRLVCSLDPNGGPESKAAIMKQ